MTKEPSQLYVKSDQIGPTGIFGGLSVNTQFKVALHFSGQAPENSGDESTDTLVGHLNKAGVFKHRKMTSGTDGSFDFFASEAELPGTNFDVTEQPGGFQGLLEYNATRRIYPDFNVTFYVDTDYYMIRMFEEWMNFINPIYGSKGKYIGGSGGMRGFGEEEPGAYYRLSYPRGYTGYKHDISITKFERDFFVDPNQNSGVMGRSHKQSLISYQFIDAFPKQVTAMPVSYQGSQLLQCSVTFGYTRYVTIHTPGGDNYDGEKNFATRASRKPRGNPTVPPKNIDTGYRSPPKLDRVTGDPGPRTVPKINRVTGDPGPRTPPKTKRSDFEPSLDNDVKKVLYRKVTKVSVDDTTPEGAAIIAKQKADYAAKMLARRESRANR